MVSFENVHIRADVEVLRDGYICRGKVRWKGSIAGKTGNWIGIELCEKVGSHNGMQRGVQYFDCQDGYGIFVKASQLRFPLSKGRSFNSYKAVSKTSFVDESLFNHENEEHPFGPFKPAQVPKIYASSARNIFEDEEQLHERKTFPLRHPVGSRVKLPENVSKRPFTVPARYSGSDLFKPRLDSSMAKKSTPGNFTNIYKRDKTEPFISPASIPNRYTSTKSKIFF